MQNVWECWPAPMEGVFTPYFVRAAVSLKLSTRWMTPFFRISGCVPRERALREFLSPWPCGELPVHLQLMADDPALLEATARVASRLDVAGLNLNAGCPMKRVVRHGGGGALLRSPAQMAEMLNALRAGALERKVSVKMRMGFTAAEEFEPLWRAMEQVGVPDFTVVHFRSVAEQYHPLEESVRSERFARILRVAGRVVLNGDLDAVPSFAEDAGGGMYGRAFLRDPYLLRRLEGREAPDPEEGRKRFFMEVLSCGEKNMGRLTGLSLLLWGADNPIFRKLCAGEISGLPL